MGKNERSWIPDAVDLDWIESMAKPLPPALAAIEAAAEPLGIPIVDRDAGRVLAVLAGGRRRIVEVGTAYGYSTLWMAYGQGPDGTIVTIDPDRGRTDLARGWWRQGGIADEQITVVDGAGARRLRRRRSGARRAVRPRLHRRPQARVRAVRRRPAGRGSRRARCSSPTTCCGAVACPAPGRSTRPTPTPTPCGRSTGRSWPTARSWPRSCPSATGC